MLNFLPFFVFVNKNSHQVLHRRAGSFCAQVHISFVHRNGQKHRAPVHGGHRLVAAGRAVRCPCGVVSVARHGRPGVVFGLRAELQRAGLHGRAGDQRDGLPAERLLQTAHQRFGSQIHVGGSCI